MKNILCVLGIHSHTKERIVYQPSRGSTRYILRCYLCGKDLEVTSNEFYNVSLIGKTCNSCTHCSHLNTGEYACNNGLKYKKINRNKAACKYYSRMR